jgi:serine/threonine-protein kinase RsbW
MRLVPNGTRGKMGVSPGTERIGGSRRRGKMQRRHFHLLAAQRELAPATATVAAFCAANGIPEVISNRMNLALDEVLSNIIKFAYEAPERGGIDVELTYINNTLTAIIGDAGKPFNPLMPRRSVVGGPINERPEGGWGIPFVVELMDRVSYDRSGSRNVLTLTISTPA